MRRTASELKSLEYFYVFMWPRTSMRIVEPVDARHKWILFIFFSK